MTTGQVYSNGDRQGAPRRVPRRHRPGDPAHHQRDQGPRSARWAAPTIDVVITEIGGTVGDIESLPFLEAARQVRHDVGRDNVFFLHVSLVPYIGPSGELKTKPTQHSVAALRSIGIQPDAIVCRSDREIPAERQAQDLADVRRRRGGRGRRRRRAVDLRHPQGAAQRGPRRLRRPPARPAVPRRRLDASGTTCCAGCTTPTRRSRSRWSASTSTCPTPTSRSPRRCAPAASPTTAKVNIALGPVRRVRRPPRAPRASSASVDARLRPRRLRRPRHRGQARRAHATPASNRIPTLGPVPRPAVHGHRVRPQRGRPREAPARPSSTRTPRTR